MVPHQMQVVLEVAVGLPDELLPVGEVLLGGGQAGLEGLVLLLADDLVAEDERAEPLAGEAVDHLARGVHRPGHALGAPTINDVHKSIWGLGDYLPEEALLQRTILDFLYTS